MSHDPLIAKRAAYGYDKNMLCCIYLYLKKQKIMISVINIHRNFEEIISGIPQGLMVGSILFRIFSVTFSISCLSLRLMIFLTTIRFQAFLKQ